LSGNTNSESEWQENTILHQNKNMKLENQGNMTFSQHLSKSKQQVNTSNGLHKQLKEQEMSKKLVSKRYNIGKKYLI